MKARFVLDAGEILVPCAPSLFSLAHRGPAVVRNIASLDLRLLGFSVLPGSIIRCQGGDTAPCAFSSESRGNRRAFSPAHQGEPLKRELSAFVIPVTWDFFFFFNFLLLSQPAEDSDPS